MYIKTLFVLIAVKMMASVQAEIGDSPNVPEECRKKGYCDSAVGYPTDYVKKLLAQYGSQLSFRKDTLHESLSLGDNPALCSSSIKTIQPTYGQDKNGDWHIIANPPEEPVQVYRVEICNEPDTQCNPIADIQNGYRAVCKQKFISQTTQIVKGGLILPAFIKLPSCCLCEIHYDPTHIFKK